VQGVGSATVTCDDGTTATVSDGQDGQQGEPGVPGADGAPGQDGSSCTTVQGDGSATVNCGDGTTATVYNGQDGAQGEPGAPGADGAPGLSGQNGFNCWDLNMNGSNEPEEDVNGDGNFSVLDCSSVDLSLILNRLSIIEQSLSNQDFDGDGYSPASGDCNDGNSTIHPGALELPDDGIDSDCDGGDVIADPNTDDDGDGYTELAGDCNDYDSNVHPGQTMYFTVASTLGSWDYDCDGIEEQQYTDQYFLANEGQYSATASTSCILNPPGWGGSIPSCGVSSQYVSNAFWQYDEGAEEAGDYDHLYLCVKQYAPRTQACR